MQNVTQNKLYAKPRLWLALLLTAVMVFSVFSSILPIMPSLTASAATENYQLCLRENGKLHKVYNNTFDDDVTAEMAARGAVVTGSSSNRILTLTNFNFETTADTGLLLMSNTTIRLVGDNSIVSTYNGSDPSVGIYAAGNLTIEGNGSLTALSGSPTNHNADTGIYVQDGTLTINGGTVTAIGLDRAFTHRPDSTFDPYTVPAGYRYTVSSNMDGSDSTSGVSDGTYVVPLNYKYAKIEAGADYKLYFHDYDGRFYKNDRGGADITAEMAAAGATISGSYGNRTITLDNFNFETSDRAAMDLHSDNATIMLVGDNRIATSHNESSGQGIYMAGNLTISGAGRLTVSSDSTILSSTSGIHITGTLTISGGTVTAIGKYRAFGYDYTVPVGYKYTVSTNKDGSAPTSGVSDGSFVIGTTYKYAKIEYGIPDPLFFTDSPAYDISTDRIGTTVTPVDVSGGVGGGKAPYTYKIAGSAASFLTINDSGVISGTRPDTARGASTLTVEVEDSVGQTQTITIDVGIVSTYPPVNFTDSDSYDVPAGIVSTAIAPIDVSGGASSGVTPYTFSKVYGPDWLSVSEAGVISGTRPETAQSQTVMSVRVTDVRGTYFNFVIAVGAVTTNQITFTAVETGGAIGTVDSKGIVLTFSQPVVGLTADKITLTADPGNAVKGTLSGYGTTWTLALESVSFQGTIKVAVANFDIYVVTTSYAAAYIYRDLTADPAVVLGTQTGTTPVMGTPGTAYFDVTATEYGTSGVLWYKDAECTIPTDAPSGVSCTSPSVGGGYISTLTMTTYNGYSTPSGKHYFRVQVGDKISNIGSLTVLNNTPLSLYYFDSYYNGLFAVPAGDCGTTYQSVNFFRADGNNGVQNGLKPYYFTVIGVDWLQMTVTNDGGVLKYYLTGTRPLSARAATTATVIVSDSSGASVSFDIDVGAVIAPYADITAPTGTITVKSNSFTTFLNTTTFGLFLKGSAAVAIEAADETGGSGVATVEYLKSTTAYANIEAMGGVAWTTYPAIGFTIDANWKGYIYARITDNADNVTIIRSDGIVVYTDSAQGTASIAFTKSSGADQTANVTLNGNTVEKIMNGAIDTLTSGTDYTVSGGTITFKASYLDTLTAGSYTLTVYYNPQGVEFSEGDIPATTGIALTVNPTPTYVVTVTNGTGGGSYEEGKTVNITAGVAPEGQEFDKWVVNSGGITLANANSASTTFTMPASAVTVTATFKDLPPSTYAINVQNDGNGTANASVGSAVSGTVITLTAAPSDGYTFKEWQVVAGDVTIADNKFSMPGTAVTVKAVFEVSALTGTATIDKTAPKIGDLLTVSLTSTNNTGTLSYQWKAGDSNVGTNSATYTVLVGDYGKSITVEITSSIQTGSVTSVGTANVVKKTAPTAPSAPTLTSKTHNSVVLTVVSGCEYSKDGTTWQDSNTFSGLTASTAYTFYQRIKETDDALASAASAGFEVTTAAELVDPVAPSITTASLAGGTVGAAYNQTLAATGDTPITWTVSVGTLPAGLTLNGGTGVISGTPTAAGSITFTIQAANGTTSTATKEFTIIVVAEAAHEHAYGAGVVTPPTYTADGFTTYTCACGDTYTDSIVPKLVDNTAPPDDNKPEKKGLGGLAIACIVIGSVLVVGLGGFAIFWFVIRKKK